MPRLTDRIPKKFQDISSLAVVFAGYFFIFEDGKENPVLTIIGASAGAWIGYEIAMYIVKIIRTNKSK